MTFCDECGTCAHCLNHGCIPITDMTDQTRSDLEELHRRGANARAAALSALDNPFYKAEAMPAATGESVERWLPKVQAWDLGWQIEDAIRGAQRSATRARAGA